MQNKKEKFLTDSSGRAVTGALQPTTPGYRLGFVSLAAAVIGFIAGLIAFILYNLIGLFTNLAFYKVWSFHFRSPERSEERRVGKECRSRRSPDDLKHK